ncbi:hypothetical protein KGQ27_03870 [Patescibacteria group bacterium]|nr:hypothetical protein [Patescibacteria group bacterium]MDE2011222.1 hypothetical protein [Patescibacteria group bacterium]MDE2233638.1 hypothetical protein [Patescibacteria group bacterium]
MNRNITATILTVLAVGIYFTYTSAKWDEVNAVRAVNNEYSQAIANADKLIRTRDQVLQSYNSLSADDRDRLDKMVPNTVDNIRLIIDLNNVASRYNLTLRSISAQVSSGQGAQNPPSAPPPAVPPMMPAGSGANANGSIPTPSLDTVTVSFDVTAPYAQFVQFMRDIEADLRITDLTHLTVTANDSGNYDFSVQLTTYWLRQQ